MAKLKSPVSYHIFKYKKDVTHVYDTTMRVVESLIEHQMEKEAIDYLTKQHYNMSKKAAKKLVELYSEGMF